MHTENKEGTQMKNGMKYLLIAVLAIGIESVPMSQGANAGEPLAIVQPADGASVPLLSAFKKAYYALPPAERRQRYADRDFQKQMQQEPNRPLAVRLEWEGGMAPYALEIIREDGGRFLLQDGLTNTYHEVRNLEIATAYRWVVQDAKGASVRGRFTTEPDTPRMLDGGKVPNVRDLGGAIGLGNRRVRQGLVFRSAGLNDNAEEAFTTERDTLSGPHGEAMKALLEAVDAETAALATFLGHSDGLALSRDGFDRIWKTFVLSQTPAELDALTTLAALSRGEAVVPDGAAAGLATADARGRVRFATGHQGTAYLVQSFMSDCDCTLTVRVGAEWFWALAVNGCLLRNYLVENPEQSSPGDIPTHPVLLRLKKGMNTIAFAVTAGSEGWCWCSATNPVTDLEAALKGELERRKHARELVVCRHNGMRPGATRINDENRDFWLKFLGIRTDIDLRGTFECWNMTGSPLGETVLWDHISSRIYGEIFQQPHARKALSLVLRNFLDRNNYPIVFHCIAGHDRTGTVAFCLGALLGVDVDTLRKDWETSTFEGGVRDYSMLDSLERGFDAYSGATIRERAEAFVKELGFTDADLATLRDILLESEHESECDGDE